MAENSLKIRINGATKVTTKVAALILNDAGIKMNLLLTVDGAKGLASEGIMGDFVDRAIPSNVSKHINFYSTNFSFNANTDSNKGIFFGVSL